MLKENTNNINNYNIIFPLIIPWNQCADFQKQTINHIKKNNNCFVYLGGDKKLFFKTEKSDNLFMFHPIRNFFNIKIINQIINKINFLIFKLFVKKHLIKDRSIDIVWLFNPELNCFFNLFKEAKIKIYDFVDFANLNDIYLAANNANLVFANSNVLKRFANSVSNKNAILVPQGFDLKTYNSKNSLPSIAPSKNMTISYIGSINFRFDFPLLHELIKKNPNYNFIFWGPIQYLDSNLDKIYAVKENIKKLKQYKNVKFGQSDRKGVIKVLKKTTVGIIPYNAILDFNRNCFPMKLLEYFYMGLPVLSTTIEELNHYKDTIHISNDVKKWIKFLKKIEKNGWPIEKSVLERKIAESHSWKAKINKIEKEINDFILRN